MSAAFARKGCPTLLLALLLLPLFVADFAATTTEKQEDADACAFAPCFNVVMRAYAVRTGGDIARFGQAEVWEKNSRDLGLDRWAELSTPPSRPKAYPRDTEGHEQVTSCGVAPVPDANADGVINAYDYSKASERSSPTLELRRRWEHGGYKAVKGVAGPYLAAFTFFTGWEDEAGPTDCEPLQREFGVSGESFGTFASYSLGKGWTLG